MAFNRAVTEELAQEIREFRSPTDNETRMFYEIVIAPEYTPDGLKVSTDGDNSLALQLDVSSIRAFCGCRVALLCVPLSLLFVLHCGCVGS